MSDRRRIDILVVILESLLAAVEQRPAAKFFTTLVAKLAKLQTEEQKVLTALSEEDIQTALREVQLRKQDRRDIREQRDSIEAELARESNPHSALALRVLRAVCEMPEVNRRLDNIERILHSIEGILRSIKKALKVRDTEPSALHDPREALPRPTATAVFWIAGIFLVVSFVIFKFEVSVADMYRPLTSAFGSPVVFLLLGLGLYLLRRSQGGSPSLHPGGTWYLIMLLILLTRQVSSSWLAGSGVVNNPTIISQTFLTILAIVAVVSARFGALRIQDHQLLWLLSSGFLYLSLVIMLADTDLSTDRVQWLQWRGDNSHMHATFWFLVIAVGFYGIRLNRILPIVCIVMGARLLLGLQGCLPSV